MRAYWILPNRDQKDEVPASDGETIRPLREILDPKLRPEGFSHGVPTELLEKCGPQAFAQILFAQRFPTGMETSSSFPYRPRPAATFRDEWFTSDSRSFSNHLNARDSN